MRDWKAIAAALKVDLADTAVARLEALEKTLLGLRGLIDWQEEPAVQFSGDVPALPELQDEGERQ